MDQPQSDGVAALRGPGRIRPQPEGQRRPRRADGEEDPVQRRSEAAELTSVFVFLSGAGASLQRGGARPPAQHPSRENAAAAPPGHALPPAGRRRGAAAQTGVSGKPRLPGADGHRQGEGTERPAATSLCFTSCFKIKASLQPRRLSFGGFGTLRKKRHDDGEEYVCPMNVEMPKSSSFQRSARIYEDDLERLEQVWTQPNDPTASSQTTDFLFAVRWKTRRERFGRSERSLKESTT